MSAMDDWFAKNMPDGPAGEPYADFFARFPLDAQRWFASQTPTQAGHLVPPAFRYDQRENAERNARKISAIVEVPDELLMDCGVIPDTRQPRKPPPWRRRLRARLGDWREQAARIAYRAIAGDWPDDGEDDDW